MSLNEDVAGSVAGIKGRGDRRQIGGKTMNQTCCLPFDDE